MAFDRLNEYQKKVPGWISSGVDTEAIQFAEKFGEYLARPPKGGALSTSQIRIAYGEITRLRLREFNLSAALMIKPKLAYAAKRAGNETSDGLARIISAGVDAVASAPTNKQTTSFNNLAQLFEAILAYHKAHGGK